MCANKLDLWFRSRGMTEWELMGVCSRNFAYKRRHSKADGMEAAATIFSKHYPLTSSGCAALEEINQIVKELRK